MADFSAFGPSSALEFAQKYNERQTLLPLKVKEAQAAEALARSHARLFDVQAREKEQELAGNAEVAAEMRRLAQGGMEAPTSAAAPFEMLSKAYMGTGQLTKAAKTAEQASQIRSHESAAEASRALHRERQFKIGEQKMELAGGLAAMATDQASFDEAIEAYPLALQARGLPPEEHPLKGRIWSQNLIRDFNQTLLSTKERAELKLREERDNAYKRSVDATIKEKGLQGRLANKRVERLDQQISDAKKTGGQAKPLNALQEARRDAAKTADEVNRLKLAGSKPEYAIQTPPEKDRKVGKYYSPKAGGPVRLWTSSGWGPLVQLPKKSPVPPIVIAPDDDDALEGD